MKKRLLLFITPLLISLGAMAQAEYTIIKDRIRSELIGKATNTARLDNQVKANLGTLQPNGAWPDVPYAYDAKKYLAEEHLHRVKSFVQAYVNPASSWHHKPALLTAIINALNYWEITDPKSWNWYHNEISNPQMTGEILIMMEHEQLPKPLRDSLLVKMNRGNPAKWTGANKMDIATHFMYRACLTGNDSLMRYSVDEIFFPIRLTTEEGIQHDLSFQQHGAQLYIYGYGAVFVEGETKIAYYLHGTSYALSGNKLDIFSNFVRKAFVKVMRGRYIDFGVNGRSISRVNHLSPGITAHLEKLRLLDKTHAEEYEQVIQRLQNKQPASYAITPEHTHYWRSDYSIHHRPGYFFGLHIASSRTAKQENGNGENLKGYYLSDGATNIAVNGNEYFNIPPVWNWSRIPGTTVPYITQIPLRKSWGFNMGATAFCGGVSDSLYGASAMMLNEYNTVARKAWFFFDKEVVCLGAGITATDTAAINTTVNQCLLEGKVTANINGTTSTVDNGTYQYNNLKWITHNGVSYYFPAAGNIHLSTQPQSGTWKSINNDGPAALQTMNVFQLWFDHGVKPSDGTYVYYVIPGQDMKKYDAGAVRIMQNDADVQAVYHKGLKVWQLVFYKAGNFNKEGINIGVDKPCVVMIRQTSNKLASLSVADPAQQQQQVNVSLQIGNNKAQQLTCELPSGAYAGATAKYNIHL